MSSVGNVSNVSSDFAVISVSEEETIYDKCFNLVNHEVVQDSLAGTFANWGIDSPDKLKTFFTEKEATTIYAILQHFRILRSGLNDLQNCFKLLNVSATIEILNPKNSLFSNFDTLFLSKESGSHQYQITLLALEALTKIQVSPGEIVNLIDQEAATWDYCTLLANIYRPLELLSLEELCRMTFFVSVALSSIDQYDSNTCILKQTGHWGRDLSPAMARALKFIHTCLSKIKNPSIKKEHPIQIPQQFRFAKPNIAALPNCIPHAANSCYMASTLTPLAFVCDLQVQQALKKFEFMEATAARTEFRALYNSLKAEAITDISIAQVDALRFALQRAYDYRYFNPNASTQEDAGDFLMCILEDLLQLGTDCSFYEKHTFQPLENSVRTEPDHYDYDEAFATKQRKLQQNMTDISLEDAGPGVKFADLATGIRRTNDLDLNAYRKESVETDPKFRTIMAHHQEQFMVESADKAPNFFCARLRRFSQDPQTGIKTKHRMPVEPSLTLQFQSKDSEDSNETVTYELAAVTVHNGSTADSGHYYCYLRHEDCIYMYNDLAGAAAVLNEPQVWQDVLTDGYIFFYKKVSKKGTA
ncbi:MAG: ubiquitin carboxyl-terminal hydrolase [Chlamydiales bacterium]|nr:ubiquitin carboxyl-terminal hydrolase [Chlamydiales bacterium]